MPRKAVIPGEKETTCRHHWIIESPQGPVSRGKCQRCGQVREFQNSFTLARTEGEPSPWRRGGSS